MTVTGLPQWLEYTLAGFCIMYLMYACGKVLARLGYSPAWCLTLFVPYIQILAIWGFAYKKWPLDEKQNALEKESKK